MNSNKANLLPDELPGDIQPNDWVRLRTPDEINLTDPFPIRVTPPSSPCDYFSFMTNPWQVEWLDDMGDAVPRWMVGDAYASINALVKVAPPVSHDQSTRIQQLEDEVKLLREQIEIQGKNCNRLNDAYITLTTGINAAIERLNDTLYLTGNS